MLLPAMVELKCQASPVFRKSRIHRPTFLAELQSGETENDCLPQAPRRCSMDAIPGVAAYIVKIGMSRNQKVLISLFNLPNFACHNRLDCRAE